MAHLMMKAVDLTVGANLISSSVFLFQPKSEHKVSGTFVDANTSITAGVVDLQSSDDGRAVTDANATWETIGSHTLTAAEITALAFAFHVVNKPGTRRVRVNFSTLTGAGAADTATVRYQEGKN